VLGFVLGDPAGAKLAAAQKAGVIGGPVRPRMALNLRAAPSAAGWHPFGSDSASIRKLV
jgi:hypothetical protein